MWHAYLRVNHWGVFTMKMHEYTVQHECYLSCCRLIRTGTYLIINLSLMRIKLFGPRHVHIKLGTFVTLLVMYTLERNTSARSYKILFDSNHWHTNNNISPRVLFDSFKFKMIVPIHLCNWKYYLTTSCKYTVFTSYTEIINKESMKINVR